MIAVLRCAAADRRWPARGGLPTTLSEKTAAGYTEQVKAKFAACLRGQSRADLEYVLGLEPAVLPDRYAHEPGS